MKRWRVSSQRSASPAEESLTSAEESLVRAEKSLVRAEKSLVPACGQVLSGLFVRALSSFVEVGQECLQF